jgi:23S rRNA-/tRNA-specific pseudouridylate synthase
MSGFELPILWDRGGLVAVAKPAGLPSTGRTLSDPACAQFVLSRQLRRDVWAVHQLDADTTGVLLFVRKASLVAPTADALKAGSKTYVALVHGEPAFDERVVDAPIARTATGHVVAADGRPARSTVTVLRVGGGFAAVQVALHTGRTHQARVHLAHLGHPLVGERRYRAPPCERFSRHVLHAARIVLADGPELVAPTPADVIALEAALLGGPG